MREIRRGFARAHPQLDYLKNTTPFMKQQAGIEHRLQRRRWQLQRLEDDKGRLVLSVSSPVVVYEASVAKMTDGVTEQITNADQLGGQGIEA